MSNLCRDDFDSGPKHVFSIEEGLWLGNLTAAIDLSFLRSNGINYIITVDSCPLPEIILDLRDINVKYIQVTDMEGEDLLSHFDSAYEFIKKGQETSSVLVHCYYGISRSASIITAYIMKKYKISFDDAFQSFKILPQDCIDVIKADPSLICARPDPKVYRCRKCRRILALQSNLLPHYINEKLSWKDSKLSSDYAGSQQCSDTIFIEPMTWMSVSQSESGKINCPKCQSKLGSYSWTMGCQCQCGAKVSPAFYFVPSKIDYSGFLQNVQVTV
ncbi:PREDICTED: dual specificity protein phosphatase 12-like [Diuraphis noxia]|uniref:dual specificity protein phosphatase 12-like n=1 Tax=Diuraphis noxia TaxID=143948 RepID=UPI00076367C9|nr:PREDICTED: dual specificity protein phosphatase 12-like [Diuraphis noxia]